MCLCNSCSWLTRRGPQGKGKHFPGKKLLTSESRKPNSTPRASASHAECSTRPVQTRWKQQAAELAPGRLWVPGSCSLPWGMGQPSRVQRTSSCNHPSLLQEAQISSYSNCGGKNHGNKLHHTKIESPSYSLVCLGIEVRSLEVLCSACLHSLGWQVRTSSSQVFALLCSVPCQWKVCSCPSRCTTHEMRADRLLPKCFGHCFYYLESRTILSESGQSS